MASVIADRYNYEMLYDQVLAEGEQALEGLRSRAENNPHIHPRDNTPRWVGFQNGVFTLTNARVVEELSAQLVSNTRDNKEVGREEQALQGDLNFSLELETHLWQDNSDGEEKTYTFEVLSGAVDGINNLNEEASQGGMLTLSNYQGDTGAGTNQVQLNSDEAATIGVGESESLAACITNEEDFSALYLNDEPVEDPTQGNWPTPNFSTFIGKSGGLLVLGDDSVSIKIYQMNKNLVCAYIEYNKEKFWLSCLYGHPETQHRCEIRQQLKEFGRIIPEDEGWVVLGDFNQILNTNEKLSFTRNLTRGARELKECLDVCYLSEIPAKGQFFTWTNNREEDQVVWERLDRAFANPTWFRQNDKARLLNLPVEHSDHGPIILQTEELRPFKRRPYRFEAMWLTHPQCREVVKAAWDNNFQGSSSYRLVQKLKAAKGNLKKWNKEVFENLFEKRKRLEQEIASKQASLDTIQSCAEERRLRIQLEEVAEQEQIFWMQKSRFNWIIQGDRNTKFYHTVTAKRRVRNRISRVKGKDGNWKGDQKEIEATFYKAYEEIFTKEDEASESDIREVLQNLNITTLNDNHKEILNKPFEAEEVKLAAFQIGPLKSPGVDGKPGIFYQHFWEVVGELTTEASLAWMLFMAVSKLQGREWFGAAMLARDHGGNTVLICRSITASSAMAARLLIIRLSFERLKRQGVERL
ncbi:Endonuclease/exonuclease/phosphatase [Corchorus olitorius]|uniref:Endonuclease/exonuclease/phosphatase n=1 Tax=Corchorus olitorius TaxID=93759 RepID=A0A1R3J6G3_9ROSI|nr:Endonuclease/exonuclease/phosphatase [Corchorus olitorius]